MKTFYILVIMLNGEPIYADERPMTFEECRHKRGQEITFYQVNRGQMVDALCWPFHVTDEQAEKVRI